MNNFKYTNDYENNSDNNPETLRRDLRRWALSNETEEVVEKYLRVKAEGERIIEFLGSRISDEPVVIEFSNQINLPPTNGSLKVINLIRGGGLASHNFENVFPYAHYKRDELQQKIKDMEFTFNADIDQLSNLVDELKLLLMRES